MEAGIEDSSEPQSSDDEFVLLGLGGFPTYSPEKRRMDGHGKGPLHRSETYASSRWASRIHRYGLINQIQEHPRRFSTQPFYRACLRKPWTNAGLVFGQAGRYMQEYR